MIPDLFLASATAPTGPTGPDIVTILTGAGPAGVMLLLFVMGLVYSKKSYEALEADRDWLRGALEKEREAHSDTREALIQAGRRADDAGQRADAAIEAANMANSILAGFQRRLPSKDD
jgi:hypothetical protein